MQDSKKNDYRAQPSVSVCDNEREEAGSPEVCEDSDGTEDMEGEFLGCVAGSDDSLLDSTFEEELDRLLEPENTEHPPYLMGTSETVEGEENTPYGTAVTETRVSDATPPSVRRLRKRAFPSRSVMEASPYDEDDGVEPLSDSEVDTSRLSECIENVSDLEVAQQRERRSVRKSLFPLGTPSRAKSKRKACAATPPMAESSESSGEDEDVLSSETEAMESRLLKRIEARALPSTPLTTRSAKSINKVNTAERRWKTEDEPDLRPSLVKFTPARTPGPLLDSSKDHTVLELFQLFFSHDVVNTLCSNTNENAKRRQEHGFKEPWKPVRLEEMYKYISVVIYMGLLNVHTVSDYWSLDGMYALPFCRTVMTMTRFLAISCSLHMCDPNEDEENEKKKGTAGYDRLMRIQPLKNQISEACRAFYHPLQNLFIDERIVRAKVGGSHNQHTKAIRYKCGFKLCILLDSQNGYTCDFDVLAHKSPSASSAGEDHDAVLNVLNVTHLGTGYHVYIGHAFASAALFRDLYKRKLGACGPVRAGFSGVQEDSTPARAERGNVQWLRDGELLFIEWLDRQPVTMCSTIHKAFGRVKRKKDTATRRSVGIPEMIESYNKHKRGVQLSDNMMKCYSVAHKTMKWYKTFFFQFVDIAVVNGFLLQKEIARVKKTTPMSHKQFREELCLQLADIVEQEEPDEGEQVEVVKGKAGPQGEELEEEPEEELVEVKQPCYPVPFIDTTAADTSRVPNPRRQCCMCKEFKTYWKCGSCQVALCLIPDRNCFRAWHMDRNNLVEEVFKRQIKYNPYPHPWMEYGGKKIEFKSQKQARCFIKNHFGLRTNKK